MIENNCYYIIRTYNDNYVCKMINQELKSVIYEETKSLIRAYKFADINTAIRVCDQLDFAKCIMRIGLLNGSVYRK